MSASNSRKRTMLPMAAPSELCILLTAGTLLPLFFTPQTKEVQINNAKDNILGNNNIADTITLIKTVKILKIHKLNLYYGN